jgi:hypothetical protein
VLDVDDADILENADTVADCARACRAVIAGNHWLAEAFKPHNKDVTVVWTGSYLRPNPRATPPSRRATIVTWAHSLPFGYPVEARLVQEALLKLASRVQFEFWLYGVTDDPQRENYLEPLKKLGVGIRAIGPLTYRRFVRSLESVAVGLHPICMENPFSRGKSFGKLLAYMTARVPIVTSREVDHALFFRHGESAALILNNDIDAWVSSTYDLITDVTKRDAFAQAAALDFQRFLTTERAAQQVHLVLRRAMS